MADQLFVELCPALQRRGDHYHPNQARYGRQTKVLRNFKPEENGMTAGLLTDFLCFSILNELFPFDGTARVSRCVSPTSSQ